MIFTMFFLGGGGFTGFYWVELGFPEFSLWLSEFQRVFPGLDSLVMGLTEFC